MQQITDLTSIILIVGEDKLCPQVPKGHPLHHQPYKDLAETVTCCGLCWARGVDTAVRSQWSYEQDHFYFVCTLPVHMSAWWKKEQDYFPLKVFICYDSPFECGFSGQQILNSILHPPACSTNPSPVAASACQAAPVINVCISFLGGGRCLSKKSVKDCGNCMNTMCKDCCLASVLGCKYGHHKQTPRMHQSSVQAPSLSTTSASPSSTTSFSYVSSSSSNYSKYFRATLICIGNWKNN